MKALSIEPFYAMKIACGLQKYEIRTWQRPYRGDLLICSSSKRMKQCICGYALAVVDLVDIVPITKGNYKMYDVTKEQFNNYEQLYAWVLENPRYIVPFPVKGQLRLYDVDDKDIQILPTPKTEQEDDEMFDKYWQPLIS